MNVLYDICNSSVLQFEDCFENYDFSIGPIISSTRKNMGSIVVYRNDFDEWVFYDINLKCIKRKKMHMSEQTVGLLEASHLYYANSVYFENEKKEIHTLNNFILSLVDK